MKAKTIAQLVIASVIVSASAAALAGDSAQYAYPDEPLWVVDTGPESRSHTLSADEVRSFVYPDEALSVFNTGAEDRAETADFAAFELSDPTDSALEAAYPDEVKSVLEVGSK